MSALAILRALKYGREVVILALDILDLYQDDPGRQDRFLEQFCDEEKLRMREIRAEPWLQKEFRPCAIVWNALKASVPDLRAVIAQARLLAGGEQLMPRALIQS